MTKRFSKYVPDSYNYTSVITIVDHETNKRSGSIDDFVELLNTLNDENEQLKCGNKNLKAILNDFINILNRLQSNPTDKQTLGVARDMLQNMGKELMKNES